MPLPIPSSSKDSENFGQSSESTSATSKRGSGLPIPSGIPGNPASPPTPPHGLPTSHSRRSDGLNVIEFGVPPLAIWSDRALATLIDIAIFFTPFVVSVLIAASASPDTSFAKLAVMMILGAVTSVAVWFGQVWLEGTRGQTIGKMILGIVVVSRYNVLTIGFDKALSRNFVKLFLDVAPLGMGLSAIRKDNTLRQTQADQSVETVVLYSERKHKEEEMVEVIRKKNESGWTNKFKRNQSSSNNSDQKVNSTTTKSGAVR